MKIELILVGLMCLVSVHAGGSVGTAAEEGIPADAIPESERGEYEEDTAPREDDFELDPREAPVPTPALPARDAMSKQRVTISGDQLLSYLPAETKWSYYDVAYRQRGCCPKAWNYSCYSTWYRLPCFYERSKYLSAWCCPILPRIYARRCLCRSCARLNYDCVLKGTCARRYTKRWFLAICWVNNFWSTIRAFYKPVPSSCYCRTYPTIAA